MSDDSATPRPGKRKLSKRLSPQARKSVMLGVEDATVQALVTVAAGTDVEALSARLTAAGIRVGPWMSETRLLTVTADVADLEILAELDGVVYVDVATGYRP